jgi:cytochrome o ubiquinol oxidase operon protein cyoD
MAAQVKTLKTYCTGFLISFVLTAAAFFMVDQKLMSDGMLYVSLSLLAIMQLIVQSVCFLGLNKSREGRWDLLPFMFTLLVIAILAGGSLWIMAHLNSNMSVFAMEFYKQK